MAVLNNEDVATLSTIQFRNTFGSSWTSTEESSRTILFRVGTGRRKRPAYPDNTDYVYSSLKMIAPSGRGQWEDGFGLTTFHGFLPKFATSDFQSGLQTPLSHDTDLANLVLIEALADLDFRDMDLGTAWAERGKTAQMVGDIATKTVRTINAARKGRGREILDIWNLSHAGARGKGVVDSYLTYHYGVKPFLQDVSGAAQALSRMPPGQWGVQRRKRRNYKSFKNTQVGLGGFWPYENTSVMEQSCRVTVSATQRDRSRQEDLAWSLGLDNPLNTAWELVPFSFVADWLVPVGDWLSALNSLKYYTGWSVVTSSFRKETCTFASSSGTVSGYIRCSTNISGGTYEKVDVRRRVSSGPPLPALPVKDPRSLDHMAKALALMASTLARGGIPRHVRY